MLAAVVKKTGRALRVEKPSETTLAFLKKHRVAPKLVSQLKTCSVSGAMSVGELALYPFSALPKANGKPNQYALRNGFLVIGGSPNGDPIAVELATGEVAFLSHDLLWGLDPECTEFEECVARSTLDLDTFWSRALAEDDFPIDFYAASGSR